MTTTTTPNKNRLSALFPGSFDPLTNGHVDIVERSLNIFNHIVVAVVANPAKNSLLTTSERVELIEKQFACYGERVEVGRFSGLLVDYMQEQGITTVIRGLRAISDYDYEAQMALMNKSLSEKVETLFLMAREKNSYVSSTLVKQIAPLGGDISKLVPPVIQKALLAKIGR